MHTSCLSLQLLHRQRQILYHYETMHVCEIDGGKFTPSLIHVGFCEARLVPGQDLLLAQLRFLVSHKQGGNLPLRYYAKGKCHMP